jgi:hypothetical protein
MVLATNLNKPVKKQTFFQNIRKNWVLYLAIVSIILGGYGVLNLTRVVAPVDKKGEIKYSTGDQPLPEKIQIWVTAKDGLYLREKAAPKSKILILIPSGTQLEATKLTDGWYQVQYKGRSGWVNKSYVTTEAPATDPTADWNNFSNSSLGLTLRYPKDWSQADYGTSVVGSTSAFGFGPNVALKYSVVSPPPVIFRVSGVGKAKEELAYKSKSGVTEAATISGVAGSKITYQSSGVQMTAFVFQKGSSTYVIEESGGYLDILSSIVKSINLV